MTFIKWALFLRLPSGWPQTVTADTLHLAHPLLACWHLDPLPCLVYFWQTSTVSIHKIPKRRLETWNSYEEVRTRTLHERSAKLACWIQCKILLNPCSHKLHSPKHKFKEEKYRVQQHGQGLRRSLTSVVEVPTHRVTGCFWVTTVFFSIRKHSTWTIVGILLTQKNISPSLSLSLLGAN